MPTYCHVCDECKHEFELEYSIKQDPPKTCPACNKESVRRMIAGSTLSRMELTGAEFLEKLPGEKQKLMKDIYSSENRFANMVGESSYNEYAKKPDRSGKRR